MATEVDLSRGDLRVLLMDVPDADVSATEIAPVRYDAADRVAGERAPRQWCMVRDLSVRRAGARVAGLRVRFDLLVEDLDHRHLLVVDDLAVLALDDSLVAFGLPDLDVRWWARAADQIPWIVSVTTVPTDRATRIVATSELDMCMVDLAGRVVWRTRAFSDVLTGTVAFDGLALLVEDANGWLYRVDVSTGATALVKGDVPGDA